MNTTQWNPGTLLETSGYYWKTCTLHAGVKLDVFTIIGQRSLSVDEVCQKTDADPKGVSVLLNALSAMGLIKKTGDLYSNSSAALTFLNKDSSQYIGFMIMHHHHLMESWSKIDKAVLNGKPIRAGSSFSDEKKRESFLLGMFNIGMAIAPNLAKELDLKGCTNLLDFGGGPGTFAIHFCLNNPELKAKIYDLPTTRPFAEKIINQFNVSDRVEFLEGNYIEEDFSFKNEFDAAWLSHIIHGEGPEDAEMIISKAVSGLRPNGKIFIHEFIMNNTMDGPLFPALFSINMFLGTDSGQSYSEAQIFSMLKNQGIKDIQRLDFTGPNESGIICGLKK
ncbi:MAG: methyltransferase [Deltaproteobacteria bacterium]|jgi:SAM-dependent methyltransferase|nr:methyltransferase [Deltaproteobacteria bacterium]